MTTLLVDANNLLMRAIFAAQRSGMSADGVATGPLTIFVNTLTRHLREEKPTYLAVAWDGGPSDARTALDAEYKGNRAHAPEDEEAKRSAFALAKEFLSLANIPQTTLRGFEADDLIAAWWRGQVPQRAPAIGCIKILSSDKDFLQLVGCNPMGVDTELIRLSSSGTPTDRWTAQRLHDEHGYWPVQWPLITALTGDKSDNVLGVPGIGPKKALKLLTAHGWVWDEAVENIPVAGYQEVVRRNLELVNLREGFLKLPSPARFRPTMPADALHEDLMEFLDGYKLATIRAKYLQGSLWRTEPERPVGRTLAPRPS